MRRGGFRRGFRRPYGRFWGRPFRPFRWWRPFWWYPIWWRPPYWMPWTLLMGGFMFFLYDSMTYKLHEDDARRIERETGKSAKNLSKEELVATIKRLGIQKLEITSKDREVISKSKKPERELSKEELVAAMKRLGIKKLEVTSEDQQVITKSNEESTFCRYCGHALSSNTTYCSKCGKKRAD